MIKVKQETLKVLLRLLGAALREQSLLSGT